VRHFGSWWSVSAPCRNTALHLASRNGDTESVKALLEKGADVSAANYHTCAIFLFDGRWLQAPAKAMRRFGSWWSVSAPCRETALHDASRNGHTESVKALLGKGAAVNAANNDKCAFSLLPVLNGRWLQAPAFECAISARGGMCRRHAGTRRCTSHLGMATRRA
jgi:hypothetical protein